MTVDGFGFGTLTGEPCLKNVHCHTDRASWDAILVTVVAFRALMWKKCAQSHRFGLGRGEGYHLGGGGRRTENRDHIFIYIYMHAHIITYICSHTRDITLNPKPSVAAAGEFRSRRRGGAGFEHPGGPAAPCGVT